MKITDFQIGSHFMTSTGQIWRCTDIGTRTILAIEIEPEKDKHWYIGPPYVVTEKVFDEKDIKTCYRNEKEAVLEGVTDFNLNIHPGYPADISREFMITLWSPESRAYPMARLFRVDRVDENGEIYHPYGAHELDGKWQIKVYVLFTRELASFPEDVFIQMTPATEQNFRQRKEQKSL